MVCFKRYSSSLCSVGGQNRADGIFADIDEQTVSRPISITTKLFNMNKTHSNKTWGAATMTKKKKLN